MGKKCSITNKWLGMAYLLFVIAIYIRCGGPGFIQDYDDCGISLKLKEVKVEMDGPAQNYYINCIRIIADIQGNPYNVNSDVTLSLMADGIQESKTTIGLGTFDKWGENDAWNCNDSMELTGALRWCRIRDTSGNAIYDPDFFQNETLTVRFKSDDNKFDLQEKIKVENTTTGPIAGSCTTGILHSPPSLTVWSFNKDSCTCEIQIRYLEEIAWADYIIYLHVSNDTTVNPAGQLQVDDNEGKNITNDIKNGKYIWKSTITGTVNFQLSMFAVKDSCQPTPKVYSDMQTRSDITSINRDPEVEIREIRDKDSNIVNLERGDVLSPKTKGPYTIDIYTKTDDVEWPDTVKLEILYDPNSDVERRDFYRSIDTSTTLRTIKITPTSKTRDCIYSIEWDGRDSIDKRILLEGEYTIKATAMFGKGKNSYSRKIKTDSPFYYNFAIDYPTSDSAIIADARRKDSLGLYEFDKVSFLERGDTNFEWLRRFSRLADYCELREYNRVNMGGQVWINDAMVDSVQKKAAWFSYIGHAGVSNSVPPMGFLKFRGNRLYPECTDIGYQSACDSSDYCLDYRCDGTERGNKVLDDVLLAVLLGCRTNVGSPSFAEEADTNGADCVIATKVRVHPLVMNFWFRNFTKKLLIDTLPIAEAASSAFDSTVSNIKAFYLQIPANASFNDVQNHLGTYIQDGDTCAFVNQFDSTFTVIDHYIGAKRVSIKKAIPARYGETTDY